MRKLDRLISNYKGIDYPEDIERIKRIVPELQYYNDEYIERFYISFSDDVYSAGWMECTNERVYEFARWLECDYNYQDDEEDRETERTGIPNK